MRIAVNKPSASGSGRSRRANGPQGASSPQAQPPADLLELQRSVAGRPTHPVQAKKDDARSTGFSDALKGQTAQAEDEEERSEYTSSPDAGGAAPEGIPASLREPMESSFGADFSSVRVHPGSAEAVALRAQAFTVGSDIFVAPGRWAPETREGRRLIAHELAHVVQQSAGRVEPTEQRMGVGLNADPALEREADELGDRAALAEVAAAKAVGAAGGSVTGAELNASSLNWFGGPGILDALNPLPAAPGLLMPTPGPLKPLATPGPLGPGPIPPALSTSSSDPFAGVKRAIEAALTGIDVKVEIKKLGVSTEANVSLKGVKQTLVKFRGLESTATAGLGGFTLLTTFKGLSCMLNLGWTGDYRVNLSFPLTDSAAPDAARLAAIVREGEAAIESIAQSISDPTVHAAVRELDTDALKKRFLPQVTRLKNLITAASATAATKPGVSFGVELGSGSGPGAPSAIPQTGGPPKPASDDAGFYVRGALTVVF
ncbi:MAG TPA: DUF4157 domain-containing protein [Polyangiaceae bacterium]|nr:DUF4157 domain-containing protein [Polyangiaceae bacterium]